jgi:hypothetical protein
MAGGRQGVLHAIKAAIRARLPSGLAGIFRGMPRARANGMDSPLTSLSNVVAYLCRHSPIEDRHHIQIRTRHRRARFSRWPAGRLGPTHACWRHRRPNIRLLSLRRCDARLRRSKRRRHQSAEHFFALAWPARPKPLETIPRPDPGPGVAPPWYELWRSFPWTDPVGPDPMRKLPLPPAPSPFPLWPPSRPGPMPPLPPEPKPKPTS